MSSPEHTDEPARARKDCRGNPSPLRVLVAGGNGYFGARIVAALAPEPAVSVIVASRNSDAALLSAGNAKNPKSPKSSSLEHARFDVTAAVTHLEQRLQALRADLVVDATGASPSGDYRLATAALNAGASYIDISDSRRHVCDIGKLDSLARTRGLLAASGASSIPALSSAVIDTYLDRFAELHSVSYGITASELTPGEAAVASVLRYCGKPITCKINALGIRIGWQGSRLVRFRSPVGWRWLARCDIPDLELFPERYPTLRDIEFRAGVALAPSMAGLWLLSWLVRLGLLTSAVPLAPWLRRLAQRLEPLGSGRSGMYVHMQGIDHKGANVSRLWQLIAWHNDGPCIPAMGSVALVRKIARSGLPAVGAMPCTGLISLDEYLRELSGLHIEVSCQ